MMPVSVIFRGALFLVCSEFIRLGLFAARPERRNLYDFVPEMDVRKSESSADQSAVPEKSPYLLGSRISNDIEILRSPSDKQVPDRAADQTCPEAVVTQPVQDPEGVRADHGPGYVVG